METTVTGMLANDALAQLAIENLLRAGFLREQISVVVAGTPQRHRLVKEETSDLLLGVMTGATVGGGFAAILAGALALPGLGLLAAGPLLAALTAGGAGAAAGSVVGALVGAATGNQTRDEYEHGLDAGAVLIGVHTDRKHIASAREVLASAGAAHLSDSLHRGHHPPTEQQA